MHHLLEEAANPDEGCRITADLALFWEVSGRAQEAAYWLNLALAYEDEITPLTLAWVLVACAGGASVRFDIDATRRYTARALPIFEAAGDRRGLMDAWRLRGNAELFASNLDEAQSFYEASLAIAEEINDVRSCGLVLGNLGVLASDVRQDLGAAAEYHERALKMMRGIDFPPGVATALLNLGCIFIEQQRLDSAITTLSEAVVLFRETGHRMRGLAQTLLATCYVRLEQADEARPQLLGALELYADVPDGRRSVLCLEQCARVAALHGDHALAARLASFVAASYASDPGFIVSSADRAAFEAFCTQLRTTLGAANFEAYSAEGTSWQIETAISAAHAIAT